MGEECGDIGNTLGDTLGAWGNIITNMWEHIKNMARTQIKKINYAHTLITCPLKGNRWALLSACSVV